MQDMILTITITIQIPAPPMPPAPADAKQPEPVFTKSSRRCAAAMCAMTTGQTGNAVRCAALIFFPAPTALNTARTALLECAGRKKTERQRKRYYDSTHLGAEKAL